MPLLICVKMFHSTVLFGSSRNSYTVSYIVRYVYTYTYSSHCRDADLAKEIKNWYSSDCHVPRRCFCVPWVCRPCIRRSSFFSPGWQGLMQDIALQTRRACGSCMLVLHIILVTMLKHVWQKYPEYKKNYLHGPPYHLTLSCWIYIYGAILKVLFLLQQVTMWWKYSKWYRLHTNL